MLDGAKCIAFPTKLGQRMHVKPTKGSDLIWKSFDHRGQLWFEAQFSLYDFSAIESSEKGVSDKLTKLLKSAVRLNSEFLDKWNAFKVETFLDFPLDWGLGSSSTLIHLLAQWADVHPLELYFKVENGSGYDVACAGSDSPIEYSINGDEISYTPLDIKFPFENGLYFVHLGKKQSSSNSILDYFKRVKQKKQLVQKVSEITDLITEQTNLSDFKKLLEEHEDVIHLHTGFPKVKEILFPDYPHTVKSLGAWGGDFVLVATPDGFDDTAQYFKQKGLEITIPFREMVL